MALDTEFVWGSSYYPQLGLIQLGLSEEECCLIDAPALGDLSPLAELLTDANVEKILHDAQQDLTILRRATGADPCRVFDARVATGFAGLSATISLADAAAEVVGVVLPKTETRTDWLQRPLTDEQLAYAVNDVRYLPRMAERLRCRVRELGNDAWLAAELATLDASELYADRDPQVAWERIGGAGRLSPVGGAVLCELAAWRERTARALDWSRGRVLPDAALLRLAERRPRSLAELQRVRGLYRNRAARFGDAVLESIAAGLEQEPLPRRPRPRWPRKVVKVQADRVLGELRRCCADRGIDICLVATRADVNGLVRGWRDGGGTRHRLLEGWRGEFVGDVVRDAMVGWPPSDACEPGTATA